MTGRIEKTVFISYRRTNLPWALCIYQNLTMHGYDVFFDYQSIDSGNFEKVILENIKARAHFLIVLTPSALERCKEPDDWLRREIETAMDENRNIVPLMLESFDFGSPIVKQALTGKLATLNQYNGLRVPSEYFLEALDRLRDRYLSVAVSDIALPSLNTEAKEITETQKSAASEASPVEKEELTAQEWFERGYVFFDDENYEEAIRCYTEAIRLKPDFADAYNNRGVAHILNDDKESAIANYEEAIRLDPEFDLPYINRGRIRKTRDDLDGAIEDYTEAIHINPKKANAYYERGNARKAKGDLDSAIEDYTEAILLDPKDADTYYERGNAHRIKGDLNGAIKDYMESVRLNPDYDEAYQRLGTTYSVKGDTLTALLYYQKRIEINPNAVITRSSMVRVFKSLGRHQEANEQEQLVRPLIYKETEYNQACFEANCGNTDQALELLKIGLEKKQASKEWARQDPDLENIRDDPRFKELVGG